MKLVQLTRQEGDGDADVVVSIGPLADDEAADYAARLLRLLEQHGDLGYAVATTLVESTSGVTAEPPATPDELLRTVLSGTGQAGDGEHDLPEPGPFR